MSSLFSIADDAAGGIDRVHLPMAALIATAGRGGGSRTYLGGNPNKKIEMLTRMRPPFAAAADPRESKADFPPGPGAGVVGAQGISRLVAMSNGGNGGGVPAQYSQSPHGRQSANGGGGGGGLAAGRGRRTSVISAASYRKVVPSSSVKKGSSKTCFRYEPLEFERDYYIALFRFVATTPPSCTSHPTTDDEDGIVLPPVEAAKFLSTSGVPKERLKLIWNMAETAPAPGEDDTSKPTMLTFPQFKVAVRMIQLYQNNSTVKNEHLQVSLDHRLASTATAAVSALVPEGPDGLAPAFFAGVSGKVVPLPAGLALNTTTNQEQKQQQQRALNPFQEDEGNVQKEEHGAREERKVQREEGGKMRRLEESDRKGQQRYHANNPRQHHRQRESGATANAGNVIHIRSVAERGMVASAGNGREGGGMDAGPDLVPMVDLSVPLEKDLALLSLLRLRGAAAAEAPSILGSVGNTELAEYQLKREIRIQGMEDKIRLLTGIISSLNKAVGGLEGSSQSEQGKKPDEELDEDCEMDVEVYWRNQEDENENTKQEVSSFRMSKGNRLIARQTSQATSSLNSKEGTIKPKYNPPNPIGRFRRWKRQPTEYQLQKGDKDGGHGG